MSGQPQHQRRRKRLNVRHTWLVIRVRAWLRAASLVEDVLVKWAILAALLVAAGHALAADELAAGKRLYREGLHATGEPLRATVQDGIALAGADAACVKCHRRSGLGGSEGQSNILPIAGKHLFEPVDPATVPRGRTAAPRALYDRAALGRALREGVAPGGRALDALMPRYRLGEEDVAALEAYLRSLSPPAQDGITEKEIHFATIVAPDVEPAKSRAMLDVLRAFFADKNAGTRREEVRKTATRMRMYRAYRTWVLHVWELEGPPGAWQAQLEAHYRRQPVFAVMGGIGAGTWRPVHEFCESAELPCVFPHVDFPVTSGKSDYAVYFSRGVTLEAEVLAKHLAESEHSAPVGPVVQVFRDDGNGSSPAQALREALRRRSAATDFVDRPIPAGRAPSFEFWDALLRNDRPRTLVVWLNGAEAAGLAAATAAPPERIFLSASLTSEQPPALPPAWLEKLRLLQPFELASRREGQLLRMKAWLRGKGIAPADERVQAGAYFVATMVGEAVTHMIDNFSRDYFIERIESMTGKSPFAAAYPRLSLGPGQRYASKGAYVVGSSAGGEHEPAPEGGWIVP